MKSDKYMLLLSAKQTLVKSKERLINFHDIVIPVGDKKLYNNVKFIAA